ncbi:hypothetical protein C8F04DRAFT_1289372 [Mycena alexandri]|uniref:F-box domain-containing protein n=1 Tax=Mycena alexandri TaxID=1745969 RepID=A0AAD6SL12_9AGAR|nr:hypothetical protein C8F04DRAFT_1289372 [Mycena alexandri]
MDSLPQEMWLRIFALVDCTKSLGRLVLSCRKFNTLGLEALLRHIRWRSAGVALTHMEFWDRNPTKTHLVRTLSLQLGVESTNFEEEERIFRCIRSFSRLNHVMLLGGTVPDMIYPTLQLLPSVTHLTLQACTISPPPPFFPDSYPSTLPPAPIQVTHLVVSKLRLPPVTGFIIDGVAIPIADYFPHLQSLVTDNIGVNLPTQVAAHLTSLRLKLSGHSLGDIQPRLDVLLARLPALVHLDISAPAAHPVAAVSQQPAPALPHLLTLSAPWPAAGHIFPSAPLLSHLRVTTSVTKSDDAIWLLEQLRGIALRSMVLLLEMWDDEIPLAAVRCLPQCETLEIVYAGGGPSDTFLFDLGIHHLPLLPRLRTLRLHREPPQPAPEPQPPRFAWPAALPPPPVLGPLPPLAAFRRRRQQLAAAANADAQLAAPEGAGSAEVATAAAREAKAAARAAKAAALHAEKTAAMRECVHAWARYNPVLQRVQLGHEEGRTWVRRALGGRQRQWDVDVEAEEERKAAWALICAAP